MSKANDITPAKFRCGPGQCPSIHKHEAGGFILVGDHVSRGELKNMEIKSGQGKGSIHLSDEFIEAFFMDFAAKQLAGAK